MTYFLASSQFFIGFAITVICCFNFLNSTSGFEDDFDLTSAVIVNITSNKTVDSNINVASRTRPVLTVLSFYSALQNYPSNFTKTWSIVLPAKFVSRCISFTFQVLSLEDSPDCQKDSVQLFDGDSSNATLLLRACGNLSESPKFSPGDVNGSFKLVSPATKLFVKFESDNAINGHGFVADIGMENCHQFVYTTKATKQVKSTTTSTLSTTPTRLDNVTPTDYNFSAIIVKLREKRFISSTATARFVSVLSRLRDTVASFFFNDKEPTTTWAPSAEETTKIPVLLPLNCGQPAIEPNTVKKRIIGGSVVKSHSWPWQVSIRYRKTHICGGALISPKFIVSAAHCFTAFQANPYEFEIWLGKHHKYIHDGFSEQLLRLWAISVHKDYGKASEHDSDIALLELAKPAVYTPQVGPVCLPPGRKSSETQPDPGTTCYVTGFGETKGTGGENFLKQTAVDIVANDRCTQMDPRLQPLVTDNMVCAYREFTDSCQGDSGGPLVCKRQGRWWLHGIVSFGVNCAEKNSPGVYTNIAKFTPWLQKRMAAAYD